MCIRDSSCSIQVASNRILCDLIRRNFSIRHILCHLSHSSCNLIAASIIHGDLEVQLIIILGKLLQFTDAFLNIRCKSRDIADNFDFHLIIPGYLDTFLQITAEPVSYTHLSGNTPVLQLKTPPLEYSLNASEEAQPYAEYSMQIKAEDFHQEEIAGTEVLPAVLAKQPVLLNPRQDLSLIHIYIN